MIIIVTGTPGTGKTTLAKSLSKKLNARYLDVKKYFKIEGVVKGYDKFRKTKLINIKLLSKLVQKDIITYKKQNKSLIIDSHLSHYLNPKYVDFCIVTKCDIKKLSLRLKDRKYSDLKIKENIESEIFDICYEEAKSGKHNIIIVDTSQKINLNKILKNLK